MTDPRLYRLGCDIGGTFTDFVLLDQSTGGFRIGKVLTTPDDPSRAVEEGIVDLQATEPQLLEKTEYLIHGTTLVINALIERKGAKTALITTSGFRDVLEMRREMRYDVHNIFAPYPTPLVPRELRREVRERIAGTGEVLISLDPAEVAVLLDGLVDAGVTAVGVCFLHSYRNPAHEQAVARIAAERHPQLAVSVSSEVMPELKEFERVSTTVVNAYVQPLVDRYLARLEERLGSQQFARRLFLMLSSGGVSSTAIARKFPVRLVESGPVGGAIAAAHIGREAGLPNVVSFDMGGTTAKSCFIRGGRMPTTVDFEVDRVHRFKKGSGTPIAVPTADVIEIGAGGGSIAQVNALNVIQVGPESASAAPGPISYRRGGTRPTVTDADLVLGYLDAGYFLGGRMALDVEGARQGIAEAIGDPLGLSVEEAAWGVHEVVNENMASAARIHIAENSGDATTAVLVGFGGAGPVHAYGVARKIGCRRILFPRGAGVFSALGMVIAPVSFEVSRSNVTLLNDLDPAAMEASFAALEAEAADVVRSAVSGAEIDTIRELGMSYRGQAHQLRITIAEPETPQLTTP